MIKVIIIAMFFSAPGNSLQSPMERHVFVDTPETCSELINSRGEEMMNKAINSQITPSPDQITHATIKCEWRVKVKS